jgi:hypothetical protein
MLNRFYQSTLFIIALLAALCPVFSTDIVGTYTVQLTTPVSAEISQKTRAAAQESFKKDLMSWLRENVTISWDTGNAMDRLHINAFARSCLTKAKEASWFEGTKWNVSYTLSPDVLPDVVLAWNQVVDTLALRTYEKLLAIDLHKAPADIYMYGIQTLFYAKGRIGRPIADPRQQDVEILAKARSILEEGLKGFTVSSSEMVVQGKPGNPAQKGLMVMVTMDAIPMPGIEVRVYLPSGKCLLTGTTDVHGQLLLESLRIPYVSNGTFLYVRPNPGALFDSATVFALADIGLTSLKVSEMSLIFKIARPSFSLSYRASAVSNFEIPRDFTENQMMLKFLRDSCRFELAPVTVQPDLIFDVVCQVSSYARDRTEDTEVKTDMQVSIREGNSAAQHSSMQTYTFQKAYENGAPIPVGLYFWEATGLLRKTVRNSLENL